MSLGIISGLIVTGIVIVSLPWGIISACVAVITLPMCIYFYVKNKRSNKKQHKDVLKKLDDFLQSIEPMINTASPEQKEQIKEKASPLVQAAYKYYAEAENPVTVVGDAHYFLTSAVMNYIQDDQKSV